MAGLEAISDRQRQDKADAAAGHEAINAFERQELTRSDLSTKLLDIFEKDPTEEQALKILNACSPYQVTGRDTPSDVKKFLSDFESLRGKVPVVLGTSIARMREFFYHGAACSDISLRLSGLLRSSSTRCGEEFVAFRQIALQGIWDVLQPFWEGEELQVITTKNMADKSKHQWKFFTKGTRPDNIVLGNGKVFFFGEEKEKFQTAVSELTAKVVELPAAMYGKLKFVICYAAAGEKMQFFMLRLRNIDREPVLDPVTRKLSVINDAPQLVLVYIKLYFMLLGMDAAVRSSKRQYQHDTFYSRGPFCRIKLNSNGAFKQLVDFGSYSASYGVDFKVLFDAYYAANSADGHVITSVRGPKVEKREVELKEVLKGVSEADPTSVSSGSANLSSGNPVSVSPGSSTQRLSIGSASASPPMSDTACASPSPPMSFSARPPTPKKRKLTSVVDVYEVHTRPLCVEKVPTCERDLQEMAYGVLRGLKALHNAGLVHRDIRISNIMYNYMNEKYVLIDLESVARDGEVPLCDFKDWTGTTLERDKYEMKYTKLSDFHQLGLLLQSIKVTAKSKVLDEFVHLLLSKTGGTTAESLLQHPWIAQVSGNQSAHGALC